MQKIWTFRILSHPPFRAKRTKKSGGFLLIFRIFRDFTQQEFAAFRQYTQRFRRFAKIEENQVKILPIAKKNIE